MTTQMVIDGLQFTARESRKPHSFSHFFLAYGTIVFAFGGASTFPTIQNDMEDRKKFHTSVTVGFAGEFNKPIFPMFVMLNWNLNNN
jgi:vesicular inhibitory amino acid transporter